MVNYSKSAPEKLGTAAKAAGASVPKLVTAAKQSAGLTADNALQQEQLAAAKALTDCLLDLFGAVKSGSILHFINTAIPILISKDMNEISAQAKNTSQAISAVIAPIKPGMVGSKECDDSIANIKVQLIII